MRRQTKRVMVVSFLGIVLLGASGAMAGMCDALYEEAQRAYQAGDYDKAVRKAVEALEIEPSYRDAVPFLHEVLPKAYGRHQQKLAEHQGANDGEQAGAEYKAIVELANLVKDFPHRFPIPDLQPYGDLAGR